MRSCSDSYLASCTRLSVHFTVPIISALILKSPSPSRAYLLRYPLCKLSRISDKQRHCLIPLPVLKTHVCLSYRYPLTLWSMYSWLINLVSGQTVPFPFSICKHLVHFTRSNLFCHSMKYAHNSSDMTKVRSDVLSIPVAFMVPLPLLNPNWYSPRTSSIFLTILLLSILVIIFSVFAMSLIFGYFNRRH